MALAVQPATAVPAIGTPSVDSAGSTQIRSVTLITGDRVDLGAGPDGLPTVQVTPAEGRESIGFYQAIEEKGSERYISVIPSDAQELIAADVLDERLFDVTALLQRGFDDATNEPLPLLLGYAGSSRSATAADHIDVTRALPSIDGAAATVERSDRDDLWKELKTGAKARGIGGGIGRVWLDGTRQVLNEQRNNQIGAPTAWQNGYDGTGRTVAVLDTGYDATHPDLAGRVTEAVDFTNSVIGVKDGHGHGTHVAGIVAGSGAQSGGTYKGVAPGATLLVGKVCGDSGRCTESDILAGMQWAAGKHPAAINMSLGGDPTDGTDPLALAVNSLTDESGSLFVISAGNSGGDLTVGSPGSADAALTVGSVTKTDTLSPFSSRGPRVGDSALKPDIAAPGQGIIAPRASGTTMGTPVGTAYTNASGTSMAAPAVAGGVALLAQRHPDWKAPQLKAALMSSAQPLDGVSVYGQGAGRLDVARATAQDLAVTSAGIAPRFRFPYPANPVVRPVSYRNDTDTAVRLDIKPSVNTPAGLFTVADTTLTVPAHGTAGTTVTVDPTKGTAGTYSGHLDATAPGIRLTTALGALFDIEAYNLTIHATGRDGNAPTSTRGYLINTADGRQYDLPVLTSGRGTARLPKGRYDILTYLETRDAADPKAAPQVALVTRTNVEVSGDASTTLDARTAKPITVRVDKDDAGRVFAELYIMAAVTPAEGGRSSIQQAYVSVYGARHEFFATPTEKVDDHVLRFAYRPTLVPKDAAGNVPMLTADGWFYNLVFLGDGQVPDDLSYVVHDRDLAQVHTKYHGHGTMERVFRRDQPIVTGGGGLGNVHQFVEPLPLADRVEYYTPGENINWMRTAIVNGGGKQGMIDGFGTLKPGRTNTTWNRSPVNPDRYYGQINMGQRSDSFRDGDQINLIHAPFNVGEYGHHARMNVPTDATGTTTMWRDGELLGSNATPVGAKVTVPDETATYTVTSTAVRQAGWTPLGTKSETTWTFRSGKPAEGQKPLLPLLLARLDTAFLQDGIDARAGKSLPVTLDVARQDTDAVDLRDLELAVSHDDGVTWQNAPVLRTGARGTALLRMPDTAGFASYRITAEDEDGNKLVQTMIRSFRIAP
ncbi:S8 family serine peptidase [Streptomyces sp. NBC_00094]|uniref:S8 family serine peptidase n=1 Tax=Streptomyces sp. NBC_00094 TaxID=2903620 RepID=UPI0022585E4B|nr:S8 family serine peptidase [Streptomyces sp. NBC_00094]MCX5390559.1 S8 family serine peptidase [Streptomyces sp. NBC_00094]